MMSNRDFDTTASRKSDSGPASSTSRSLVVRLQQNEAEAWQRMVSLYGPLVDCWCRGMNVPQQDLPDLLQDVLQTVAKSVRSFSKERPSDTFRGWLRTITRSRVVDWQRRSVGKPKAAGGSAAQSFLAGQPFDSLPLVSTDPSLTEDQLTQQLYLQALQIIREHFHPRTWHAFWRVVVDGHTPKEVARELSMQPGAVRVAKSRVLHRLRVELGDLIDC